MHLSSTTPRIGEWPSQLPIANERVDVGSRELKAVAVWT